MPAVSLQPRPDEEGDGADRTDAELWAAFLARPASGFEPLYRRHCGLVYGLARKMLGNAQDAEDLAHEIFMTLLTQRSYEPGRGSLAGFLGTMTRSRAIDRLRKRAHALGSLDQAGIEDVPAASPSPQDAAEADADARAVHGAMAALPATQRQVLELAYFKGLSQSEIAAYLDAPLGTVKTWARQGLFGLRDALGTLSEQPP